MRVQRLFALISMLGLLAILSMAQEPTKQNKKQTVAPAATSTPVAGSGTTGQIPKWLGTDGFSFTIGDSNITEDKSGKVGIGTRTPTSALTVRGMIETFGGIKFPDGTVQTTSTAAALFGVAHDSTLQGNGTGASPIGVGLPLNLSGSSSDALLKVVNLSFGEGVHGEGVQGVFGKGVDGANNGGIGVVGLGGGAGSGSGGFGAIVVGGGSIIGLGGVGLRATGGTGGLGFGSDGLAGDFAGNVDISGNLSVSGTTNFVIDHPLDPENKYLSHAAIESSEGLNLYSGNAITDASGEAVVTLPEWFQALNKDLRYQLTVIGTFAQAIVAEKVKNNRFTIRTNAPGVEVSWLVTGIRSDAVMLKHPFRAEENKVERERGHYLSPEAYGQPEEKGIEWARNPELMQRLKQQRLEAQENLKKQQQR